MSTVIQAIVPVAERVLGAYVNFFADIVFRLAGVEVKLGSELRPVDQRLARLEDARVALVETLSALDDLQIEAEASKADHVRARAQLEKTLASKVSAEKKLSSIQKAMKQDVSAFQELAGVPNIGKERLIGFLSGVVGSILVSVVWTLGAWVLRRYSILG